MSFTKEELSHKMFHKSIHLYLQDASIAGILISPLVYSMIIPLFILDFWAWFYQWLCFPIYNIVKVDRSKHMTFDRGELKYLNIIEQVNCNYCAYANGVIAYVGEIAAKTEQYFCPIKHSQDKTVEKHSRYCNFLDYGDAAGYRRGLHNLRTELREKIK